MAAVSGAGLRGAAGVDIGAAGLSLQFVPPLAKHSEQQRQGHTRNSAAAGHAMGPPGLADVGGCEVEWGCEVSVRAAVPCGAGGASWG